MFRVVVVCVPVFLKVRLKKFPLIVKERQKGTPVAMGKAHESAMHVPPASMYWNRVKTPGWSEVKSRESDGWLKIDSITPAKVAPAANWAVLELFELDT
jgi:hypothetical protein